MKQSLFTILIAGLVALGAGGPAMAHHSFGAAYDMNAPQITVKGVIAQVRLQNPHSWFFLDVKDETGKTVRWAFEAGTPSGMIRNGFKPGVIKQGVAVTIKGFRARDTSQNMGMLRELTTSDGQVFGMFGPQEGAGK